MALTQYYVNPAIAGDSGTGTSGDPFGDLQYALNTITRDSTNGDQINIKAGTSEVLAASLTLATYGTPTAGAPLVLRGYTSAANDGGVGVIDCNGVTMWASATYNSIVLADLEIHNFGNNNGISLSTNIWLYRCKIHKGASSPSGKSLVITSGVLVHVILCEIYNPGSSGICVNLTGGIIAYCYANTGSDTSAGGLQIGNSGGLILNNIVVCGATGAYAIANNGTGTVHVIGNSCYNSTAGTVRAIQAGSTSSRDSGMVLNNIVCGWSGTGGFGVGTSANAYAIGYNAFYNNATNVSVAKASIIDLTANDTALGALPWVNAGSGDFDINGTVSGVTEAAWPAAFLNLASTSPKAEKGAVQAGAPSVDYPAVGDVQTGVTYGGGSYTGTFAAPAVGDVQTGVGYGASGTEYTGTLDVPTAGNVRSGTGYGAGGTEFTGTLDLPAVGDVQSGVTYDGASKTGTFVSPAVGDVQNGVTYGNSAEFTGTFTAPAVGDVQDGVAYGAGGTEFTGTLVLPAEAEVESGVGFGAGGTEFTGSLVAGSDWSSDEKDQIRKALGVTGTTAATSGTGNLDTILTNVADLSTDAEIATAVRTELATELARIDAAISSRSTYAGADTAGTTTLLARIIGTLAAGTHNPQSGDSYPVVTNATYGLDKLARTGADGDTLETLSDQLDGAIGITPQQVRDAMKLAPTVGTPADGSVDDHLDDLATALAAATTSLTVVSAVDGDVISIYQAVSLSATISGLSIPASWTKVYWTVKRSTSEADADAIVQLVETNPGAGTDGLLRLNGAAGTAANGSLTVDQAAGTVEIALDDGTTDDLALATGLVWSLKALYATSSAQLLAVGTVNVLDQATLAVA